MLNIIACELFLAEKEIILITYNIWLMKILVSDIEKRVWLY